MTSVNVFKNTVTKVKYLVTAEKGLSIEERKQFQWQLLADVPGFPEFKFVVGKGGANTIYYYSAKDKRELSLPDDAIKLLEKLALSNFYCYAVFNKSKDLLAWFLLEEDAVACEFKGAAFIAGIKFDGKRKLLYKREKSLYDKYEWVKA